MLPSLLFWVKLTVAFTYASLPLNLYTAVFGCGCGFGSEQKFWRINGFGEAKARISVFAYPYSPPSLYENEILFTCKFKSEYGCAPGLT